jgi:hypothetical protein
MKFNLIPFPSSIFSWMRTANGMKLVAEASDMGNRHLQPLYDDACDVGFAVESVHTGAVVTYVLSGPFYREDGEDRELAGWNYIPTLDSCQRIPDCIGTSATIYND